MTLQKKVGIFITALSLVTVIGNLVRPQPDLMYHTILSIISGGVTAVAFGISIFFEHITIKIVQVLLIAIVGSITALIPDNELIQVIFGVILILISINIAWAYDFFDKRPIMVLIISMGTLTSVMALLQKSIITGATTALGISAVAAIFWAISYDKVRRLQEIAKRAMDLAKRADPGETNG